MLDIKFIRENPEAVRTGAKAKNIDVDVDAILKLDAERRTLIGESETIKAQQNRESEALAKEKDVEVKKAKAVGLKKLKDQFKEIEARLETAAAELDKLLRLIPNLPRPDVVIAKDDSENYSIRTVGQTTSFGFKPRDYMTLGEELDLIDTERAAKVAAARFGFLKNEAVLLEFALIQYAWNILLAEKFVPLVTPVMINEKSLGAMGYLERGRDEIYHLEKDDLFLIGTSEHVIGPMHADEIFMETELPKRYAAFSTCFRREAGSYGKDVRGILRVHQFDKIEMFSFTLPEHSDAEHEFLLSIEERLMKGLGLPYRVLGIVSGDLGDPAARKFDIETWIPSQNTYRETHSTSTCTDWQARRLNIRVKRKSGELQFAHTLNGTAFAIGRMLIAIMENFQQEDGSIAIPPALVPYMGGRTVIGAK
ncbi:MAG: serine--tRNA ligase [Patescibacteria group bacterium]|jgi:seryl-tRNA synthetase